MNSAHCFVCGRPVAGIWKEEDHGAPGRTRAARGENTDWPVCASRLARKPCHPPAKVMVPALSPVAVRQRMQARAFELRLIREGLAEVE